MKTFSLIQCALRVLIIFVFAIPVTTQAALIGRDLDGNLATFEAYYDTDQNITWLADTNYAQTSGYDSDGVMTWSEANTWADGLTLGGYTNWRLANTVDAGNDGATTISLYDGVDAGYNISVHSEMSYMFYETLSNTAYYDTSGMATGCSSPNYCLTNTGPFSNLQPYGYWSATEYWILAWYFDFFDGAQAPTPKPTVLYAWAVHSGDVGASVVPVPTAAWLFGSALLGLAGLKRKK